MPTIIRILAAGTNHVLREVTRPATHVRDVVAALAELRDSPDHRKKAVDVQLLVQPEADKLAAMEPAELENLQDTFGTPPNIPLKLWHGKTPAELADKLEAQCNRLSTPEGITATLEGLAVELSMFGGLVAMHMTTVRYEEDNGQHTLKTSNSLRIMDKRLLENPAAVAHLRDSITNSVDFVKDALDRALGKQPANPLVGPDGTLLT